MRLGITLKLFLAILATCIVVAVAMGAAVRLSFERGFEDYVTERETRRAQAISEMLAEVYRETGDWRSLQDNPRLWWRVLRSNTGRGHGDNYPPPPPFYLLDTAQRVVVGADGPVPRQEVLRQPVKVNEQVVGWLVMPGSHRAPDAVDERFQMQQVKATWVIVALSVLLAALVSILLARLLLAPVKRIAQATHRLAAGDYATRVAKTSRDEMGQLAHDFNQLALTLQQNERLRRELMDDISHELRTPLAVLRGELEALQDGVRTLTPASLESLQAEAATLNKLIDDLQELARADTGGLRYHMTRVDLCALLRQAGDAWRERLAGNGIQLSLQLPERGPVVQADAQRLVQVFNNLLENSLRYTDAPGELQISLQPPVGREAVTLRFEDSAPGVPPESLPRLFERLYRVDASRSRARGGAGLGLAICQRIIEAHQGSMTAAPSPLGGLSIVVTLPPAND